MINNPNALCAENISCHRGLMPIFEDLNFTVARGEVLLLTGANGSGKTTLLRALAGLLPLSDGALSFNALSHKDEGFKESILFLSQDLPLKPALSVMENLKFLFAVYHIQNAKTQDLLPLLRETGIEKLADYPVRYLSSGQKRRVIMTLLRAAPKPLILLDEPTTHLDVQGIDLLCAMLNPLRDAGCIIIIATHSPEYFKNAKTLNIETASCTHNKAAGGMA